MIRTLAAALATTTCIVALATPAAAQTREYNIPAGSLKAALDAYVRQSGRQVVYRADEVRSARSPGVRGSLSSEAALAALLAGSGFTTRIDGNLIAIVKGGNGAAASSLAAGEAERVATTGDVTPRNSMSFGEEAPANQEIVVVGTHIRGIRPAGTHVIELSRDDITKTGRATVAEALNTRTEFWTGGTIGDSTALILNRASAINLRGLGADSTLILVNGRRQPTGGLNGAVVDIASLAATAIERIEILPDGASALYGSDAVGGVVNIVLRDDYDGAETDLKFSQYNGGALEARAAQLLGTSWATGSIIAGYQYFVREPIERIDRKYTAVEDYTVFGGSDFRGFNANPGNIICPVDSQICTAGQPAFAIPEAQDGSALSVSQLVPGLVNRRKVTRLQDLTPRQEQHSAFGALTFDLWSGSRLSIDVRYSSRDHKSRSFGEARNLSVPSTNPFYVNPFATTSPVIVAYDFIDDVGPVTDTSSTETFVIGGDVVSEIASDWQMRFGGAYGSEKVNYRSINRVDPTALTAALANDDPEKAFNPFGDGSNSNSDVIDSIRFEGRARLFSETAGASIILDGPVVRLPGGSVKLAIGADYRGEHLSPSATLNAGGGTASSPSRNSVALFGELSIPVFSRENARPGLARLIASLSGRYEHYSDFGSTFNPRIGVSWSPIRDLSLRATWGTSFKAPRLVDLLENPSANTTNAAFAVTVPDPNSADQMSRALFRFGGNAALKPEKADTWSLGFEYEDSRNFRLSLNYFSIDYRDRISSGGAGSLTLTQSEVWSSLIDRNPTEDAIGAICGGANAFCFGATPTVIVDLRLKNLGRLSTRGVDFNARKSFSIADGEISVEVGGTYTSDFERKISPTSESVEFAGTVLNPPKLKVRGTARLQIEDMHLSGIVNYLHDSTFQRGSNTAEIPSWATIDLMLGYRISTTSRNLKDVEISLGVLNALNDTPPFVDISGSGHDSANTNLLGRLITLQLSKRW